MIGLRTGKRHDVCHRQGSFLMNPGEFETTVREDIPLIIVVMNDRAPKSPTRFPEDPQLLAIRRASELAAYFVEFINARIGESKMRDWKTLKAIETGDHILTVTMNRPERRNAISSEMAGEMEALFTELKRHADLRVVILTGEGTAFCAGADLKERSGFQPEQTRQQRETVLRVIELMETLPMPVIGMVNGPAFAGGFELALGCDFRIASDRAVFALTEVRNVGSFPGAGGPVRLPKLVGRGRASYIVLTGRSISADQAFTFGLAELVVPHADLTEQTLAVARDIAGNSPAGISAAKKLIRQSNDLDVYSSTELSRALRDPLDKTGDYAEGLKSWLDKRAPDFKNQ